MKTKNKRTSPFGERLLTIYSKFFSRDCHRYVIFPEIRLTGKWLEQTGFQCGDSIVVKHEKDQIIITKVQKAPKVAQ